MLGSFKVSSFFFVVVVVAKFSLLWRIENSKYT